jgi:hypothetical protein
VAAHATVGAIGAVGLAAPMVPVRESPLLRLDALGGHVLLGAVAVGVVAGLVEGLLLRLPNREVGQGLGIVVVLVAAVPVFGALVFAYAPWWPDDQRVPVGNLVTALLTWTLFLTCVTVAALPAAPRAPSVG